MAPELSNEPGAVEQIPLEDVLGATLTYARRRDYRGWDYGDGMSSRILRSLPVESKWLNIAFQELAKRPPVNIRPLLRVEQRRNFKGTALFAMANLNAAHLHDAANRGPDADYADEARRLVEWLVRNRSVGFSGFCGGHSHPIQHLDGRGRPNDPDVVSTSYAVRSLLAAGELDDHYPEIAETAAEFVENELRYREVEDGAKIDYHLNHPDTYFTINSAALGARLLTDLYACHGNEEHRRMAREILDYIATKQTREGGWYYRDPPSTSHLSMDNHHNAFVVEAYLHYRNVCETARHADVIDSALDFYRNTLFEPSGAPNWDESNSYPKDVHACANGALVFTYADDPEFARRILEWTIDNLHAGDGQFYYRKQRFYTKRVTLMRWCQAWMSFALSEFAASVTDGVERTDERILSSG